MKFKFHLEKVLKHKKLVEDQAKREFGEISRRVFEQENYLKNLEEDLCIAFENKYRIQQMGGNIASYLEFFHYYYGAQKQLIENQKKIIEGLQKILEEKRQHLIQAAREHKTFIALKEKKKQEFIKEQKKRDQKRIDEMNIMRQNAAVA